MDRSEVCNVEYDELYHHGVIGQKWGVRRYQNEDGTLTEEGKEHYSEETSENKSEKKSSNANKRRVAAAIGGTAALGLGVASGVYLTNKLLNRPEPPPIVVERPKQKLKPISISDGLDSVTNVLKKIDNLGQEVNNIESTAKKSSLFGSLTNKDKAEDKKKDNKDDKDNKKGEKKTIKQQLDATNGTLDSLLNTVKKTSELQDATSAAGAKIKNTMTNAAGNVKDELERGRVTIDPNDSVIKKGQKMTNLSLNPNGPQHTAMWVTDNDDDREFYRGVYGSKLMYQAVGRNKALPSSLYEHNYVTTKDIKVAGKDRASKVFADIYKGSDEAKEEFWKRAEYYKDKHPESFTKAYEKLKNASPNDFDKVLQKEGYPIFNSGLVNDYSTEHFKGKTYEFKDTGTEFYKRLSAQGYGAVEDVFDKQYSSFHTKSPKIVFADRGTMGDKPVNKESTVTVSVPEVVDKLAENAPVWALRQRLAGR